MTRSTQTAWRVSSLPYRPVLRLVVRFGRRVRTSLRETVWVRRVGLFIDGVRYKLERYGFAFSAGPDQAQRPENGPVRRVGALQFTLEWVPMARSNGTEIAHTAARLRLQAGPDNLTANRNVWSDTVHESVLVSAYPLALWLAASWWRLHWEPLPAPGTHVSLDWRRAHEMEAAGYGFVWPHTLWVSDGEAMHLWAVAARTQDKRRKAVRYVTGTGGPVSVPLKDFTDGVEDFLTATVWRLKVCTRFYGDSTLRTQWDDLCRDRADPRRAEWRRFEAELGFAFGQCPNGLMDQVLILKDAMGRAVSELLPAYGRLAGLAFVPLQALAGTAGVPGRPVDPRRMGSKTIPQGASWLQAAVIAREVRAAMGVAEGALEDKALYELLGITKKAADGLTLGPHARAAVGIPVVSGAYRFLAREGDRSTRRFEWARLFADFLLPEEARGPWLASTDLMSWRQKYQRAFAAELLCPFEALQSYLNGNTSAAGVDLAARDFGVPVDIVEAVLAYNGILSSRVRFGDPKTGFPMYQGRFASQYAWLPGGKGLASFRKM
ncbi:hypothetical protein [Acidiferrobacter sp.]